MNIELVLTSCGFGVPFFEYLGEREGLKKWAESRGRNVIEEYWKEKIRLVRWKTIQQLDK